MIWTITYLSSAWRYKTLNLPVLFSHTFSKRNVWNATLLAFLVHDVMKHFIFPYFFKLPRLKCNVTCFSCTWRYKTWKMKCFITSCTRKAVTLYFKRCGLKKNGKKVRENEMFYNVMYKKSK
jgi:hypothetical protein